MPRITGKQRKTRDVEFADCCGKVCDERCWETSIREHQYDRRLSTAGGVRVF
jgi:hypothetical protein